MLLPRHGRADRQAAKRNAPLDKRPEKRYNMQTLSAALCVR